MTCPLDCTKKGGLYLNTTEGVKKCKTPVVNYNGIPTVPKAVLVNYNGKPEVVWPLRSEIFKVNRYFQTGLGGGGNYVTTGGKFTREDGSVATFPVGWTGKISFWSAPKDNYCVFPTNDQPTTPYATAVQTSGCCLAWLYIYWGIDGGPLLDSTQASHYEKKFTKDGLLEDSRAKISFPVGQYHTIPLKNDPAGRPLFTFNYYYDFSTPLTRSANSLELRADTSSKNFNQLYWQYGATDTNSCGGCTNQPFDYTLRMAVTTTSTVEIS